MNCICKWTNGKKSAICNKLNLTSIPSNLSTEIQVLFMNDNNITYLNREEFVYRGLNNLQRIYLKNSQVKYLHRETFKNLKILIEIDLSDNLIEQFDKQTFSGNDRLRIIYLYGNPIKILLSDQFPVLPYLRNLDLHNCNINLIEQTAFSNLDLLEYLNLGKNRLEYLPQNLFNHMKNLKTLNLADNPWNCNCKLKKFHNWYLTNANQYKTNLLCAQPQNFRDKSWDSIPNNDLGCVPNIEIYKDEYVIEDIGINITYKCLAYGEPRPKIFWNINGKNIQDIEHLNDNILIEETLTIDDDNESSSKISSSIFADAIWSNLTIINITIYDSGYYTCTAYNKIGVVSKNLSLILPEIVEHVIIKTPETFWYFGLILGIFFTIFSLISISIIICICKKYIRKHKQKKYLKKHKNLVDKNCQYGNRGKSLSKTSNSINSFNNDSEKKLLDLSLTTTTTTGTTIDNRYDFSNSDIIINTPSSTTTAGCAITERNNSIQANNMLQQSGNNNRIEIEPVQITIENISSHNNDEYQSMNVGVYPSPPPEFCSKIIPNPTYGNIFISVSLTQDTLDQNPDLNMYPDLLNIPNRVKNCSDALTESQNSSSSSSSTNGNNSISGAIIPINVTSYATLPRNGNSSRNTTNDIIDYHNLNTQQNMPKICSTCQKNNNYRNNLLTNQQQLTFTTTSNSIHGTCENKYLCLKYDNMGRRVTAGGNSTLSLPDEIQEEEDEEDQFEVQIPTPPLPPIKMISSQIPSQHQHTILKKQQSNATTMTNPDDSNTSVNDFVSL